MSHHLSTRDQRTTYRTGTRIIATHPRLHPTPGLATVLRDFGRFSKNGDPIGLGPKDTYIRIRFDDDSMPCTNHHLNCRPLTDEDRTATLTIPETHQIPSATPDHPTTGENYSTAIPSPEGTSQGTSGPSKGTRTRTRKNTRKN